jgi:hypothetical protein
MFAIAMDWHIILLFYCGILDILKKCQSSETKNHKILLRICTS